MMFAMPRMPIAPPDRPRPWGVRVAIFVMAGVMLAGGLPRAFGATYRQGGKNFNLRLDTTRVAIELDRTTSTLAEMIGAVAAQGYTDPKPIPYAISSGQAMYSVRVGAPDDRTLSILRSTPGVKSARRLYYYNNNYLLAQSDRIALKPKPGTTPAELNELLASEKCVIVKTMGIRSKLYGVRVTDEAGGDSVDRAARLAASPLIEFAHPDFYAQKRLQQTIVDDPLFAHQWHLENRGQNGGAFDADIDAPEAWEVTMGEGAVVAILDDAVDWQHPDMIDSVVGRYDFTNDDADPTPFWGAIGFFCLVNCDDENILNWEICDYCNLYPYDPSCQNAHGTCTAGLAVARANDIGVRGVAPMAGLVAEAMLGAGLLGTADAFFFAESHGAHIASNSWGFVDPTFIPDIVVEAIEDISQNGRNGLGVLVMFSSGNGSTLIEKDGHLATLPEVMAIGASLKDDRLTCYSSFGPEQSVVAPGGGFKFGLEGGFFTPNTNEECFEPDIVTTDITSYPIFENLWGVIVTPEPPAPPTPIFVPIPIWSWCPFPPEFLTGYNPPYPASLGPLETDFDDVYYHDGFKGTSAACPVAAGCAALVFSVNPNLTAMQVRGILEHTADKVQPFGAGYDPVTGHSDIYGHGRVNANRAVRAAAAGRVWPAPVRNILSSPVADQTYFEWQDPNPVTDVNSVLVVRANGPLNWAPVDGVEYVVGQQVAANTVVVANDVSTSFRDDNAPDGTLNYAVFVKNGNAYYSWGRRVQVESKSVPDAPLASATASPSAGSAPLTVLFSGGAIDPQGRQITTYQWDFGDGSTGVGPSVEHTYATPGPFLARVTATNSIGLSGSATVLVTVESPSAPTAAAFTLSLSANPNNGAAPLAVAFTAVAYPVTAGVQTYDWDFGDGTTDQTIVGSTTHTYTALGNFTASVTATDVLGASVTASTSIVTTGGSGGQSTRDVTDGSQAPMCGVGGVPMLAVGTLLLAGVRIRRRYGR